LGFEEFSAMEFARQRAFFSTLLDVFGRVVDQRWIVTSTGTATDRFQYGYDRDGNVLWKNNLVDAAFGEVYSYDGLSQLASFARGTLNSAKTGITGTAAKTESWSYDALGNRTGVTVNGTSQTDTANDQNEVTGVGGATTPTYDAAGNMTGDENGLGYVYDAWNRLVVVKSSGGTTLETFSYDGMNRRVTTTASGATTDLYYSTAWQVLEEQVGGAGGGAVCMEPGVRGRDGIARPSDDYPGDARRAAVATAGRKLECYGSY
jgi:YD repeat-containing protein